LLARIAVAETSASVRTAAVGKLTDRALLAKFAEEAEDSDVRYAANQRLAELTITDPVEPAGARAGVPAAHNP